MSYTIESLYKSEASLRNKLHDPALGRYYPEILHDHYHHALDILWGWQQLHERVETFPNTFIDKHQYLDTAEKGIDRMTIIAEATRETIAAQRYLVTGDE